MKYLSEDGKVFKTKDECISCENAIKTKKEAERKRYEELKRK
jgi:hypothetical protein